MATAGVSQTTYSEETTEAKLGAFTVLFSPLRLSSVSSRLSVPAFPSSFAASPSLCRPLSSMPSLSFLLHILRGALAVFQACRRPLPRRCRPRVVSPSLLCWRTCFPAPNLSCQPPWLLSTLRPVAATDPGHSPPDRRGPHHCLSVSRRSYTQCHPLRARRVTPKATDRTSEHNGGRCLGAQSTATAYSCP